MTHRTCSIDDCPDVAHARGMCNRHYLRWWSRGTTDPRPVPTPDERFWPRVDKGGAIPEHRPDLGPCWLWTGATNRRGYGVFGLDGGTVLAHRYAYTTLVGDIPDGLEPDHLCRVPACVRPSHQELVTHAENCRRGLSPAGLNAQKTECVHGHPFDETNTIHRDDGSRTCRTCRDAANARRYG